MLIKFPYPDVCNIHQCKIYLWCLKRTIAKRLDNPQYNLAATRENNNVTVPHKFDFQQYGILTTVGSDNPMKSPFELRNKNDVRSVA